MKRCVFVKDVAGIYFTPLIGYSNVMGVRSLWIGWLWWLFVWNIGGEK